MNKIFSIFHVACIVLFAATSRGEDILISVSDIASAEQSRSQRVGIFLIVHEPKEARNALFHTYSDTTNRTDIRKEYPLSGLFHISVSEEFLAKLIHQKNGRDQDELIIDTGIDPRDISNAYIVPEMEFSLFVQSITKHKPEPNQSR